MWGSLALFEGWPRRTVHPKGNETLDTRIGDDDYESLYPDTRRGLLAARRATAAAAPADDVLGSRELAIDWGDDAGRHGTFVGRRDAATGSRRRGPG